MNYGRIYRADDHSILIPNVKKTVTMLERMRGLLWQAPLASNEGLLIVPCNSVHTLFMNYALDLLFLDRNWTVIKTVNNLLPWRMAACRKANMVLELQAGSIASMDIHETTKLEWRDS